MLAVSSARDAGQNTYIWLSKVSWTSSQLVSWIPRVSIWEKQPGYHLLRLASGVTLCHFYYTLLIRREPILERRGVRLLISGLSKNTQTCF